jgi:hypothetical protein
MCVCVCVCVREGVVGKATYYGLNSLGIKLRYKPYINMYESHKEYKFAKNCGIPLTLFLSYLPNCGVASTLHRLQWQTQAVTVSRTHKTDGIPNSALVIVHTLHTARLQYVIYRTIMFSILRTTIKPLQLCGFK